MKNTFFRNIVLVSLLFSVTSLSGQVRVKSNKTHHKKKIIKKNQSQFYNNQRVLNIKRNRNRIVTTKPNRPKIIVQKPNYKRSGYVWVPGFWQWSVFTQKYVWRKARWKKIKHNHYWVPGFWEITPDGFFWVQGYWQLN